MALGELIQKHWPQFEPTPLETVCARWSGNTNSVYESAYGMSRK